MSTWHAPIRVELDERFFLHIVELERHDLVGDTKFLKDDHDLPRVWSWGYFLVSCYLFHLLFGIWKQLRAIQTRIGVVIIAICFDGLGEQQLSGALLVRESGV